MANDVPGTTTCPYCAEPVAVAAKKCKHCGEILDATMRELELLKNNQRNSGAPTVFMNAGGGSSSAAAASSSSSGSGPDYRSFLSSLSCFDWIVGFCTWGLWILFKYLLWSRR